MVYGLFSFLVGVLIYEYHLLLGVSVQSRVVLLRRPSGFFCCLVVILSVCGALLAVKKILICFVVLFISLLLHYFFRRKELFSKLNSEDESAAWGLFSQRKFQASVTARKYLISDAISVVFLWFFIMIAISLGLHALSAMVPNASSEAWQVLISTGFSAVVILLLIKRAVEKFAQEGFAAGVGLVKKGKSFFKIYFLPAAIALGIAFVSAQIIVARPVDPHTPLSELLVGIDSTWFVGIFLFMAVIVAPFVEEIVFRGYLFHVLSTAHSKRFALYICACSFSVLHFYQYWGDWSAIMIVTILGFVLTLVRIYARSTVSSVVLHYVYNGGVTIFAATLMYLANPAFMEYQANFTSLEDGAKIELMEASLEKQPHWPDVQYQAARLYHDIYSSDQDKMMQALDFIEYAINLDPKSLIYKEEKLRILQTLKLTDQVQQYKKLIQGDFPDWQEQS